MFNRTAEIFIDRNGLHGLERLRKLVNQDASLRDIACAFNVSVSTAGRLREILFKKVYYVSDATADWLRYCEQQHSWISEQYGKEHIKSQNKESHLTLIQGEHP
jgi:hypothetical protein